MHCTAVQGHLSPRYPVHRPRPRGSLLHYCSPTSCPPLISWSLEAVGDLLRLIYLLKTCAASWKEGILSLEAGSGLGTLHRLMRQNPTLFQDSAGGGSSRLSAYAIYSCISCFLVSHGHLDHVNGLVLSAGALANPPDSQRRRIYAARNTLEDLETLFSDRLWPSLASWKEDDDLHKLLYDPLAFDDCYREIFPDVSVRMMPTSHGSNGTIGNYRSSAFFIRHNPSSNEFLFFGDVEPDSVSGSPATLGVWQAAAQLIPDTLTTIFIECSWPSGRTDEQLYGHLNPEHLLEELTVLATEVVKSRLNRAVKRVVMEERKHKKRRTNGPPPIPAVSSNTLRGALSGVRVYIIHCKDDLEDAFDRPINHVIRDQVKTLVEMKGLGAEILSADQGTRIVI
ncbi:hypothetical protein FA95DRAFT_1107241 [Auriscalpium vulgare]|uniref:Uncharacterized protein n=1 Tax=Auriscalpium vulgare TaxID=40419 RepID=A0ACB8RWN3_9AGAM|nr:hypothetical protein FA95DRAFT_1107241 [Auriscalpium vulgare]